MFFLVLLDADCSGRILATLLVVWVTTAMVASVLLQWEYMWIVLAVMTLLFLLLCGYTAYNVKKAHARILIEEQRRAAIRTISNITATNSETESTCVPPLSADLPPSYASVVSMQTASATSQASLIIDRAGEDKFEDPPSYSIVIASLNMQDRNAESLNESNVLPPETIKKDNSSTVTIDITETAVAAAATTSASVSATVTCSYGR